MSAYSAWPHLSAAIVLTHGMPWYSLRIFSTSPTVRARSGWRAWTATGRGSMATGCPSRRYDVGSPGTSVSWYGVNRNAVETVWLHAMVAVWTMLMSGTPYSPTPVTLT